MAKSEIKYPEVECDIFKKGGDLLTVEVAKELVGWYDESESKEGFGTSYFLKDVDGNKVRILNNATNRPFRIGLAKRWGNEILRNKWALNGETIVIDRLGQVQSGQHRLIGLILAEQIRQKNKDYWKEYGTSRPLAIEAIVVKGISEHKDVVDTLDIGQKRSLGDVIFRNKDFSEKTPSEQKTMSNILAIAIRLAWLRVKGQSVSDAPHFPHSEALEFFDAHPRLQDAVEFIVTEDGGSGDEGRKIRNYLSLGYAAALLYLMGTTKTKRAKYDAEGEINDDNWDAACGFWTKFASGVGLTAKDPVLHLRKRLQDIDASGALGRDEVVGTVVKAFNAFVDGIEVTVKDITVKKGKNDANKLVLAEEPRLGGLDVKQEPKEKSAPSPKNEGKGKAAPKGPKAKVQVGKMAGEDWAVGDTAWVTEDDIEPWFGKVDTVCDDGEHLHLQALTGDKGVYEVVKAALSLEKPDLVAA